MSRPSMILGLGAFAVSLFAASEDVSAADYRALCLERMKVLIEAPQPSGSKALSDCVRDDITTGQVDLQSMGFAALSDNPTRNVQKLIDAGFPARTAQGAMVIGTLNNMFVERKISGETYLEASTPLIGAGALVLFGDGPLDVLAELLRNSPDPETVCSFAAIVGGFEVFEDRNLPRDIASTNPAFEAADIEMLTGCGL